MPDEVSEALESVKWLRLEVVENRTRVCPGLKLKG